MVFEGIFFSHSLAADLSGWGPSHFSPERDNEMRLGKNLKRTSARIANEPLNFAHTTITKEKTATQFLMLSNVCQSQNKKNKTKNIYASSVSVTLYLHFTHLSYAFIEGDL